MTSLWFKKLYEILPILLPLLCAQITAPHHPIKRLGDYFPQLKNEIQRHLFVVQQTIGGGEAEIVGVELGCLLLVVELKTGTA